MPVRSCLARAIRIFINATFGASSPISFNRLAAIAGPTANVGLAVASTTTGRYGSARVPNR
jgi:hypothetical protein